MAFQAPTTDGPHFTGSGPISWSDLRQFFRAQNPDNTFNNDTAAISVSELYRNTSTALTDPTVPDCTENRNNISPGVGVPSSGAFAISRMRNTIKYYYLTQVNTDQNLNISSQSWNNNLGFNIRKFARINGTVGSSNPNFPAAQFSAQSFNMTIDVNGNIFGAGGAGAQSTAVNGQGGGNAITVNSPSGNNNTVFIDQTGKVYGGGGGGGKGGSGGNGGSGGQSQSNCGNAGQQGPGAGCCEGVVSGTGPAGQGQAGGNGRTGRGFNNQSGTISPGIAGVTSPSQAGSTASNSRKVCGNLFDCGSTSGSGGSGGQGGTGGTGGNWGASGGQGAQGGPGGQGGNGTASNGGGCVNAGFGNGNPGGGGGSGTSGGGAGTSVAGGINFNVSGSQGSANRKGPSI